MGYAWPVIIENETREAIRDAWQPLSKAPRVW
jgi:hypothetical protein